MKRLIPLLLLAACGEPTAPPSRVQPQPPPPAQASVAEAPAPTPAPTPNSPEEAREIARTYLEAKHPGREAEVGEPGAMEGAAGSIYIEIPATVGELSGTLVLRRVNDVPGSTAEQRRWHVEGGTLK